MTDSISLKASVSVRGIIPQSTYLSAPPVVVKFYRTRLSVSEYDSVESIKDAHHDRLASRALIAHQESAQVNRREAPRPRPQHVTSTDLVLSGALGTWRRLGMRWDRGLAPPMTACALEAGLKGASRPQSNRAGETNP
jgi:hypothetical protein